MQDLLEIQMESFVGSICIFTSKSLLNSFPKVRFEKIMNMQKEM